MKQDIAVCNDEALPPVALAKFQKQVGRSGPTVWRWIQKGWLPKPFYISNRPYLRAEDVHRFNQRAANGEFQTPLCGAARKTVDERESKNRDAITA